MIIWIVSAGSLAYTLRITFQYMHEMVARGNSAYIRQSNVCAVDIHFISLPVLVVSSCWLLFSSSYMACTCHMDTSDHSVLYCRKVKINMGNSFGMHASTRRCSFAKRRHDFVKGYFGNFILSS